MKTLENKVCARCNEVIDFTKVMGYYRIKDNDYCTECGRIVNEERKPEITRDMFNELFFGDEM